MIPLPEIDVSARSSRWRCWNLRQRSCRQTWTGVQRHTAHNNNELARRTGLLGERWKRWRKTRLNVKLRKRLTFWILCFQV